MYEVSRRQFLRVASVGSVAAAAAWVGVARDPAFAALPSEVPMGARPPQDKSVQVLNPRGRVPLGFIIDDSTCLVNMGAFCMPQFKAAWPQNPIYWKKWESWPREIPDSFVREFGEFCADQGVRGKFSLVPYPACVGWLDRDLPGWSRQQLQESLKLIRELMVPRWDITPEMVTHTRVIDIRTGRAMTDFGPAAMENSYPPEKKSADELAAYIAYALTILKNCEIPCMGITTPGGFGNKCRSELSLGVRQAVTDVFASEIPFYFKYIADGNESTAPRLEHVEGGDTDHPRLIVNVPAGTGDMFGGWDGDRPPEGEKYINDDATAGRMVELIERGGPAIMFGHWAGLFSNGSRKGFEACKRVILAINGRYRDRTIWMKTSEMARYWAARELTRIERDVKRITFSAPFAATNFTFRIAAFVGMPSLSHEGKPIALREVSDLKDLSAGSWMREREGVVACFDLPKGTVVAGAI